MTDISQSVRVSVDVGKVDSQALDIAQAYLEDCYTDYVFFRYSGSVYFLFTGNDFTYEDGVFTTGDNFHVTELQAVLVPSSPASPRVDTFSGEVIGLEAGVAVESINGTITREPEPKPLEYYYISTSYDMDSILEVDCSADLAGMQPLVYTNLASFPRLIDGGSNHAFTTNFILLIGCFVLLFQSVFRHVSN